MDAHGHEHVSMVSDTFHVNTQVGLAFFSDLQCIVSGCKVNDANKMVASQTLLFGMQVSLWKRCDFANLTELVKILGNAPFDLPKE